MCEKDEGNGMYDEIIIYLIIVYWHLASLLKTTLTEKTPSLKCHRPLPWLPLEVQQQGDSLHFRLDHLLG